MWAELMDDLCEIPLGLKPKLRIGPSVRERMLAAYEKVMNYGDSAQNSHSVKCTVT